MIRRGNKTRIQRETLNNMNNLFNERDMTIKFIEDYGSMILDKLELRRGQKTVALSSLSIYYTGKNIKSSYNNNKFQISAPT